MYYLLLDLLFDLSLDNLTEFPDQTFVFIDSSMTPPKKEMEAQGKESSTPGPKVFPKVLL